MEEGTLLSSTKEVFPYFLLTFEFNKINSMNNSYISWFKGGALCLATIFGMAACSDDHYDIVVSGETEGKTIWQNIKENEDLSEFASVLSATSYLKSDMDFPSATGAAKMTYAEFLNSPQSFTVWAPKNGSFEVAAMLAQLEEIKSLYATDRMAATKAEYIFATQFLGQHIARFNHEAQGADKRVRMLNSKYVVYDASEKTFDGIDLVAGFESLPSSNGTLHLIEKPSMYIYNIYDYLTSSSDLTAMNSVLFSKEFNTTSFSPGSSTEGAMNSEGKMEYVDSVYVTNNTLLNMTYAQLRNEDSVYVAVFPTNDAWEGALAKVKSLFNYKDKYSNFEGSVESGDWKASETLKAGKFNYDSLATLNATKLLFSSMYFSPSVMGKTVTLSDSTAIIDYCLYNDSVNTTNWKTIYNSNKGGKNPFFLGADNKDVQPVKVSNGYIFPVDSYNLDLAYSFLERRETGISVMGLPSNGVKADYGSGPNGMVYLSAQIKNDSIIDRFDVKSFQRIEVKNVGTTMKFTIPLPALKSGSYNVYAIVVPSAISKDLEAEMDFTENISFNARIYADGGEKVLGDPSTNISAPSDHVEKVLLFKNFNLEYSYDGLPDGTSSYPCLEFELTGAQQKGRGANGKKYCTALNFYKIIIEPYREDSTNE